MNVVMIFSSVLAGNIGLAQAAVAAAPLLYGSVYGHGIVSGTGLQAIEVPVGLGLGSSFFLDAPGSSTFVMLSARLVTQVDVDEDERAPSRTAGGSRSFASDPRRQARPSSRVPLG